MRCRLLARGVVVVIAFSTTSASAAQPEIRFTEVSLDARVRVVHDALGYTDDVGNPFQNHIGPGAAWVDVNRDGWLDLVVGDGTHYATGNHLFFNEGDGTFTDLAEEYGILTGHVTNAVVAADVNNDGFSDVLFANHFAEPDLTFGGRLKLSASRTLYGLIPSADPHWDGPRNASVAIADYDRDGWLDLFFVNQVTAPNVMVRGIRGTTFYPADVIPIYGADTGFQAMFFDFDDDGDQDLFVVNDVHEDYLFRNDGGTALWPEIAGVVKISGGRQFSDNKVMGMGCTIADFDNDLDLDVYVTNYRLNTLFQNPGTWQDTEFSRFREVAADKGVDFPLNSWGCDFFDADNDGDLDLFVVGGWVEGGIIAQPLEIPNRMYQNQGPPDYRFTDVSETSGVTDGQMGRAQAVGDYDRDGDLDVFVTNNTYYDIDVGPQYEPRTGHTLLYRNDTDLGHHWVTFWLQGGGNHGNGVGCNRDGIGAHVYVTAGGSRQLRAVQAGSGYMGHNSIEVEFGLGETAVVDDVQVRWPCGFVETFGGCDVDGYYRLVEGEGVARPWPIAFTRVQARSGDEGIELQWWFAAGLDVQSITFYRAAADAAYEKIELELQLEPGHGMALDTAVEPEVTYRYRVELATPAGNWATSPAASVTYAPDTPTRPGSPTLGQNFPNPFNPTTRILVSIPRRMPIELTLYDVRGKRVRTLYSGWIEEPGTFPVDWDGRDDAGAEVGAGIYYYALSTAEGTTSRKLTLVR